MALVKTDQVRFQVDGLELYPETVSDIGESTTEGQAGIDPATGQRINAGGEPTVQDIVMVFIFDSQKHAPVVDQLLKPAPGNSWYDGSKRATLVYPDKRYIISGLAVKSWVIPGVNGLSKDYGRMTLTFSRKTITPGN